MSKDPKKPKKPKIIPNDTDQEMSPGPEVSHHIHGADSPLRKGHTPHDGEKSYVLRMKLKTGKYAHLYFGQAGMDAIIRMSTRLAINDWGAEFYSKVLGDKADEQDLAAEEPDKGPHPDADVCLGIATFREEPVE